MPLLPGAMPGPPMVGGAGGPPPPPIEAKFAAFINTLTPEEQRQVGPLMGIFASTISAPEGPTGGEPPPPPPTGLNGPEGGAQGAGPPPPTPPGMNGPAGPMGTGMSPTGVLPPDPGAIPPGMSIGRQKY